MTYTIIQLPFISQTKQCKKEEFITGCLNTEAKNNNNL